MPKYTPIILFILKFFAGLSVFFVYSKFYDARYSSDIFKYFDDGIIIHSAIYENPWDYLRMITGIGGNAPHLDKYYYTCYFWMKPFNYGLFNDNLTVIRFNALVRLISMGNIHIHTLIISFLSFTGLWGIYKVFLSYFKNQKWLLVLVVFFIPSLYFWTSGLLKEGILMFAFGMLLYSFNQLMKKHFTLSSLIVFILSIFLLLISKFYILVAALPGLAFIFLYIKTKPKFIALKYLLIHVFFLIGAWLTKPILGISFPEILAHKQHDFINYINSLNYVGSKIEIQAIEPNLFSLIKAIPQALYNSLFRPTLFEVSNAMMLMAALENLLIVAAILLTIFYFTKRNLKNHWFLFCVSFTLILFALSGLTTPVLGALVRYKAPALPFLAIALLFMINFEKLNKLRKRDHIKKLGI
ncbi:MAG: hypothetical protein JEZ09_04100 [Salinivirgaceae bacterium]|nr:hypothetical protein [Salinivirgaceae bacterium]